MIKQFADGTVELRMSGASCPPDFHGQAGSRSSCWFRVDNGQWEQASYRSMHRNAEALECAGSVSEFRQLLEIL